MKRARNPLFLSYSSKNTPEVDSLDLELCRRGVVFFRDRKNLGVGRLTDTQIEEAARNASGFIFYLTEEAARSEWVRERELELALEAVRRRPDVLLIPVFQDEPGRVTELMLANTDRPELFKSFDFRQRHGHIHNLKAVGRGRIGDELRQVAGDVTKAVAGLASKSPGQKLRLALSTRGGLDGHPGSFDLFLDWSQDFPADGSPPSTATCEKALKPALEDVRNAVKEALGKRTLHVALKSHLTPALALGYRFGRTEGIEVEVLEVNAGITWNAPVSPRPPLPGLFEQKALMVPDSTGRDLVVAVNICQPRDGFRHTVETAVQELDLPVGAAHEVVWAAGPSKTALSGYQGSDGQRIVVDLLQRIESFPGYAECSKIHFFNACTPGLAFLFGQQLVNTRPIQTYEWIRSEHRYQPSFLL